MKVVLVKADLNIEEEKLTGLAEQLPQERRERISRFRQTADQIRSVTAGLLLQRELIAYLKTQKPPLSEADISAVLHGTCQVSGDITDAATGKRYELKVGEHGKPYLAGADDFFFSISHSGEYIALAVDDQPIGVDIEAVQLRESVTRRFYAKAEQAAVHDVAISSEQSAEKGAARKALVFTEIWTRKEAWMKWDGRGLHVPLAEIEVLNSNFCRKHGIGFSGMPVEEGKYYLSVCAAKPEKLETVTEILPFATLMDSSKTFTCEQMN